MEDAGGVTVSGADGTDTLFGIEFLQFADQTVENLVVEPVNNAPTVTDPALTVAEGETVTVSVADLGVADVDDADGAVTIQVSGVSGGLFERTGAAGTPIPKR